MDEHRTEAELDAKVCERLMFFEIKFFTISSSTIKFTNRVSNGLSIKKISQPTNSQSNVSVQECALLFRLISGVKVLFTK